MNEQEALEKFRLWYVEPVEKLKELPYGSGGFAAFMVGLALYERLIVAKIKITGQEANDEAIQNAMNEDLRLSDIERRIFWDMFRNGLFHQAMPKIGRTGYCFDNSFTGFPEFKALNGHPVICIDPWKFTDRVINELIATPKLIVESESYPLPSILPIPFNNLTEFHF
jgi:hypothetical protein